MERDVRAGHALLENARGLVTPKVPVVPTAKIPKKKPIVVSPQKESKKPYVQPLEQGNEFNFHNCDVKIESLTPRTYS